MFPLNNIPFRGKVKMDTKVLGGWTYRQTESLNSLTICSLQLLALGYFLILRWIFSPVCCILPRYYISFVVFVSFPVPYTLRSCSEMPCPAGTDLHTNNIALTRGVWQGETLLPSGTSPAGDTQVIPGRQPRGLGSCFVVELTQSLVLGPAEPSARFHNWRYHCRSLALREGMGKQRLKMGVGRPSLMSWRTQVTSLHTHFPWSEYLLQHTCVLRSGVWANHSKLLTLLQYRFLGSFFFPIAT